ncbi:hypothetical protein MCT03_17975 [Vibrio aestuarianus]|nr:hypothetical protein [Vibrio aestuarianus]
MSKSVFSSSYYLIIISFLICLILVLFGTLIGGTSFKNTFLDVGWHEVLSSIGSILAGVGTCFAAFFAFKALTEWEKQWRFTKSHQKSEKLLELLNSFQRLTLDISVAQIKNVELVLCEKSSSETKIDLSPMQNDWDKYHALIFENLLYLKGKKLYDQQKIVEFSALIRELSDLAYASKQASTDMDFEENMKVINNRSLQADIAFSRKISEIKLWLCEN